MKREHSLAASASGPPGIADLPLLATPKQAASVMGLTVSQVRGLIRDGRIARVRIGNRILIPRDAIERFIQENTVKPCHVEIQEPASASSESGDATTSSGQKMVAAGSAARARQIANRLKSRSPNSSTSGTDEPVHVIHLRS
jgi:excisionase family DNA binding protein